MRAAWTNSPNTHPGTERDGVNPATQKAPGSAGTESRRPEFRAAQHLMQMEPHNLRVIHTPAKNRWRQRCPPSSQPPHDAARFLKNCFDLGERVHRGGLSRDQFWQPESPRRWPSSCSASTGTGPSLLQISGGEENNSVGREDTPLGTWRREPAVSIGVCGKPPFTS